VIWSLVPLPCRNPACSSAISVSVFTRILSSMMRRSIIRYSALFCVFRGFFRRPPLVFNQTIKNSYGVARALTSAITTQIPRRIANKNTFRCRSALLLTFRVVYCEYISASQVWEQHRYDVDTGQSMAGRISKADKFRARSEISQYLAFRFLNPRSPRCYRVLDSFRVFCCKVCSPFFTKNI